MKPEKLLLEVTNLKKGTIYRADIELRQEQDKFVVYRRERRLAQSPNRTEALLQAAEKVLQGFHEPAVYTAYIDGMPYTQKEVERVPNPTPEPAKRTVQAT
jgi:hypothetical protein